MTKNFVRLLKFCQVFSFFSRHEVCTNHDHDNFCDPNIGIIKQSNTHTPNPMLTMRPAVASIQEKANKGHSLALAVSYSLRYDKHHSNPTLCRSPVEMLNLWESCVRGPKLGTYSDWGLSSVLVINKHLPHHVEILCPSTLLDLPSLHI